MTGKSAADIRSSLSHPVIDNDGHILEITPLYHEHIRAVGGDAALERYKSVSAPAMANMFGRKPVYSIDERRDRWIGKSSWWSNTCHSLDRASSMLPRLLNERLDDLGIDFAILYPSEGLLSHRLADDELRCITSRAINEYQAELYRGWSHRLTGVAVIPMGSPAEAITELEHAVNVLGFRAALFASSAPRHVPAALRDHPEVASMLQRLDWFGIDSEHDYDPVWRKCEELGVPASFHGMSVGASGPISPSSLPFNRLGGLNAYTSLTSALLLGGVIKRFPGVNFVFQEGGVGWACDLYGQVLGIWEKRNGTEIHKLNPAHLDTDFLRDAIIKYGDGAARYADWALSLRDGLETPEVLDEFAAMAAESLEDVRDQFVDTLYFGCEADDVTNARAFSGNALGARFKITLGSDIGHWDVPDANHVLGEAYELVEDGSITEDDFRRFVFTNAVELYGKMNPQFFAGSPIQDAVAAELTTTQLR